MGESMVLGMASEVSERHASPSLLFLLPACRLRREHSASSPAITPAAVLPAPGPSLLWNCTPLPFIAASGMVFLFFIFILCVCMCMYVYIQHVCSSYRGQERGWDFLELQLQTFLSFATWVLGTECRSSGSASKAP